MGHDEGDLVPEIMAQERHDRLDVASIPSKIAKSPTTLRVEVATNPRNSRQKNFVTREKVPSSPKIESERVTGQLTRELRLPETILVPDFPIAVRTTRHP